MKFEKFLKCALWIKVIILLIIAMFFIAFLFNPNSKGMDLKGDSNLLNVNITAGFQGQQAPEGWIPLTIEIENKGNSDFQGILKIEILKRDIMAVNNSTRITTYNKEITIEQGRKRIFPTVILYEKDFFASPHLKISRNNKIIYDKPLEIELKIDYSANILVINQSGSGYDFLKKDNTSDSNRIYYLQPKYMSEDWLAYREMDLIILGKGDYTKLNKKQIDAIKNWISQGNKIIITATGDFLTYNSQLINEISPCKYVKKEMIEINNSLAEIWYLRNSNNNLLLNNGNPPQVIKANQANGEVICVALEPLVMSKKEELYFNFLSEIGNKGYTDYAFLDKLFNDFAASLNYQYPNPVYLFLIFVIFIIFIIYLYQKIQKGNLHFGLFMILFIIISLSFTALFYMTIGQNIISNNNILSEVAIIEMKQGSEQVLVESYFSFLSHFASDTSYYIDRDDGFLDGVFKKSSLKKVEDFRLQNNRVNVINNNDERWKTGQFRAYYRSEFPIKYELFDKGENYKFSIENNTNLNIKYLSIFYNNQWFYADNIKIGEKANVDISKDEITYRENRSRSFKKTVNMDSYLTERLLNEVITELTNYQVDLEKKMILFGLVEGQGLKGSVKFRNRGNRLFSGVFYLPLNMKKLRGEEVK